MLRNHLAEKIIPILIVFNTPLGEDSDDSDNKWLGIACTTQNRGQSRFALFAIGEISGGLFPLMQQ